MTPEQEAFLVDFANKGLAELAAATQREAAILAAATEQAALAVAMADLEVRQTAEKAALVASVMAAQQVV